MNSRQLQKLGVPADCVREAVGAIQSLIASGAARGKDAKDRIKKHEEGLEKGNRVNQRTKWLAEAKRDLESGSKDLEKASAAVEALEEVLEKHEDVEAPVIEFEKQFQHLLDVASNDLSKRAVLAQAKAALAKFEAEMSSPKFASDKEAGNPAEALWDLASRGLRAVWKRVQSAFAHIEDWAGDLTSSTKRLDKLLTSV